MKTITIIAEQMTDRMLAAATPARGVDSVNVTDAGSGVRGAVETGTRRAFRSPGRFDPRFRVDMVVEDDAVESVYDCVEVAYGAGFFGDAEMWVNSPALALSA